jgi:hypothetical protein
VRHPVWTLLVVIVLAFAVVTLVAIFAGETHHSGYMPTH